MEFRRKVNPESPKGKKNDPKKVQQPAHADARSDFLTLGISSKHEEEAVLLIKKLKERVSNSKPFIGELLSRYFSGDLNEAQLNLEMTRVQLVRHVSSVVIRILEAAFHDREESADAFHSTVIVGNGLLRLVDEGKFLPVDDNFHSPEPEFLRRWIVNEHSFFSSRLAGFAERFGFSFNRMPEIEKGAMSVLRAYIDNSEPGLKDLK